MGPSPRSLRRKLPEEIFAGRRILPSSLFRRDDVASYLANLQWALDQTVTELGARGSLDLFGLTHRLGHRMGLASWAGPGSAEGDGFERLVSAFDILDGSDAFVHPVSMAAVAASDKRAERAALDEARDRAGRRPHPHRLHVEPDDWNPDRWRRHRLAEQDTLPSPMMVTAFGDGRHSCPAQPFSLAAMTAAMTRLLGRYEMTPRWSSHPRPVPEQIGGVARADGPCPVDYAGR